MLKTFNKGGVHPPENKLSVGISIKQLSIPETVFIPISQHIGAPAKIVVAKGDMIKTGQLIAATSGFVSANIHSSVTGKVKKIDKILDSSGYRKETIIIDTDADIWTNGVDTSTEITREITASSEDIVKKVTEAGIVGLGGATFPSHVKLSVPAGKKAEYLIINGVECEPYLTSDHTLMMEKGEEILIGVKILMKGLKVTKCIIGIENNKPDAISYMTDLALQYSDIIIQALKVKYPQGGEKQLIKATINREVPSGALPIEVGAVVFNVGTAFAVYEAVQKNKPLIERVVTVTGKSIEEPQNFKVRIGTPVSKLLEAVGGVPKDTGKIINGGPMMGKALGKIDVPIVKGSSGILVIPENEANRKEQQVCIRCAKCVSVCPMGLEPFLLMTLSEKGLLKRAENERIMDCIECGSCSYKCPSNRQLLDYIRLGKVNVSKIIRSRKS